ncbi:hypothetical protein V491_03308 [Pseudogymnoascus sp. VKM F-3775]|nr:hypothetical protein V491_03308 [Pseudogymnoascus sp. VKM F-3775]
MNNKQTSSRNLSIPAPGIPDKSVITDAPISPGQRGNLNFDGIPVNEDIDGDFPVDKTVISANRYRSSASTVTAPVVTEMENGEPRVYFLKCAKDDTGRAMMEGEVHSMTALYTILPEFFPEPYAWGKFSQNKGRLTYFLLYNFIKMSNNIPDPTDFCRKATNLWDPCWESYFRKMLKNALNLNTEHNGTWTDLEEVVEKVKTIVLKLLGLLELEGRSVKPSLIQGDLWVGNVGIAYGTGEIYTFDAGAYYAHNEMGFAMWRGEVNKALKKEVYVKEYLSNIRVSGSYNSTVYLINRYQCESMLESEQPRVPEKEASSLPIADQASERASTVLVEASSVAAV